MARLWRLIEPTTFVAIADPIADAAAAAARELGDLATYLDHREMLILTGVPGSATFTELAVKLMPSEGAAANSNARSAAFIGLDSSL